MNTKTGIEFHVDVAANQFVTKTLALGVHGYHYNQITDDSGRGARLGDFQSKSTGVGPGFVWIKGAAAVTGKWMWDVPSKRRFDSSYGTLSVGWKF